ncbi:MAG: biopolymer transporter ExbD [Marinobacter sp.]|uniref:ExbD/TolR family protein n=1 Tax=Marinobacter sp. TaxID=50741 RepID=UPI00299E6867|nr:biopolymer transporter ExbD [Marinobacter sp.]MDX1754916.1 biopolymer transporter ExbD [Marinobacter sp.]
MRRKHRRPTSNPDLDITAFLNLMIVLVPVLLLGMVFSQVRVIELNFPGMAPGQTPAAETLTLVVTLTEDGFEVADRHRGLIRSVSSREGRRDYAALREVLKQVKQRLPDKSDVILEVPPTTDYQTLVTTIDTLRSYDAVVAASVVKAELFPDVSLADPAGGDDVAAAEVGT